MTKWNTKSLAQIVNDNHRAAAVFEKYHLDFCCQGKRSLEQACTERSLSVEQLVSDLETATRDSEPSPDFKEMSLSQLSEYIVSRHHAFVKNQMPQLFAYLERVASKHGDRHPEMREVFKLFSEVREEMDLHMQKEELILFPRIRDMERRAGNNEEVTVSVNYLQSPVDLMEAEHEHAGRLLDQIRQLTGNYVPPNDACATYRLSFAALQAFERDLHEHVHLENNILFPKAIEFLKQIRPGSLN